LKGTTETSVVGRGRAHTPVEKEKVEVIPKTRCNNRERDDGQASPIKTDIGWKPNRNHFPW
jgi:hypothetical protein